MITPLVDLGSPQLDHSCRCASARAANGAAASQAGTICRARRSSATCPIAILVWNTRPEVRGDRDARGAAGADHRHRRAVVRPVVRSRSRRARREQFCERVGLRADRPFVLYLCSSLFRGTASEAAFVEQWVEAVRSSADPRLKDIGILIRPHPARLDEWKNVDLSGYRNLTFWGAHPVSPRRRTTTSTRCTTARPSSA